MIVCWLGVLNLLEFLSWVVTFWGLTENREFGDGNYLKYQVFLNLKNDTNKKRVLLKAHQIW